MLEQYSTSCRWYLSSTPYGLSIWALRATLSTLAKLGTKPLSMNISAALLDRVDKYRFKRMFPTRSEAIEFLLDVALKLNPKRSINQKSTTLKGSDER
jgi:hypothetical protein